MFIDSFFHLNASHAAVPSDAPTFYMCLNSTNGAVVFTAFTVTNIVLLLPVCLLVLYVEFQRWRRQRTTPAAETTSQADLFTFHMVILEIFSMMGSICYSSGNYMGNMQMMMIVWPGQCLFHCLTCVEHHLAVLHPITYLGLRGVGGVRIRNVSIGLVWLTCVSCIGVTNVYLPHFPTVPFVLIYVLSLLVSSSCSLSVLCALVRPGPGDGDGGGDRVDRSKQRAFHIILAILAALVLRFVGVLLCIIMFKFFSVTGGDGCVMIKCAFWFCLPSSLVLPLLFLQRAGKQH